VLHWAYLLPHADAQSATRNGQLRVAALQRCKPAWIASRGLLDTSCLWVAPR
jgi:hypothetical protein